MSTSNSETATLASPADAICDQALAQAGLSPRWTPAEGDIPPDLVKLADKVGQLADLPQLKESQIKTVSSLGNRVAQTAILMFKGKYSADAYRAHTAIERDDGNCISYHEVVAGMLGKLGLGKFSYGYWTGPAKEENDMGKHAASGLLVADTVIEIDGWFGRADLYSKESNPELHEAVTEALEGTPTAVVAGIGPLPNKNLGVVDINQQFELHQLNQLDIAVNNTPYWHEQVILPASAAILMFSASTAVRVGEDSKHPKAAQALRDYAPRLAA